jgi:hypothetical protein
MAPRLRPCVRLLVLALAVGLGAGCVGPVPGPAPGSLRWFAAPAPGDPWSPKIAGWQARERGALETPSPASAPGASSVSGPGAAVASEGDADALRRKYERFRRERQRAMAREVAEWIQREARTHYRPDGPIDHWATLEETLATNGDDCDGLELLVYHFLRDLGFAEDEVYRAIVVRPSDGQHHMVTLWFESPEDPFVIDPTGAMTSGMPRMSEVPGWVPLKLFTEREEYSVVDGAPAATPLASRSTP